MKFFLFLPLACFALGKSYRYHLLAMIYETRYFRVYIGLLSFSSRV